MSAPTREPTTATERWELAEVAAGFARRRIAPLAPALDRGDVAAFEKCWSGICELGLERALLPDERGGAGLRRSDLLALLEQLAHGDGGVALCVLLSNAALSALSPERGAAIPEGERWAAVPVPYRPAAGSGTLQTGAEPAKTISGAVPAALGARGADAIVLVAGAGADPGLVVAADAQGFASQPTEAQMGLRAAGAAELSFEHTPVDEATPGARARALVLSGVAAIARGIARRAYEDALAYAETRRQGGAPIVEHGAVRLMLAEMAARLRDGHDLASTDRDGGGAEPAPDDIAAALAAKARATDAALATATDAVQVLGGTGYVREAGVEKLLRDARYCQLYPEPNWVARDHLLELDRRR